MNVRYRITARPAQDKDNLLVYELYEAQSDADASYSKLIGEDTILQTAGFGAIVVAYEEFVHGNWALADSKLITIE